MGENKLFFKLSHFDENWEELHIPARRSGTVPVPTLAYRGPLKLPEGKYSDLISLCNGPHPVVRATDACFYRNLPH